MRDNDQPRKPSGSPDGGQWRGKTHLDTEISLGADEPRHTTYCVTGSGLSQVRENVERANKRLERAGIDERFEVIVDSSRDDVVGGELTTVNNIHLNTPVISYDGWDFIGKREVTAEGDVLVRGRDEDLDDVEAFGDSIVCDHCGRRQNRSKTYVVRDRDGQTLQVGSTCVQNFLGVRPEGLWSLDVSMLADVDILDDEDDNFAIHSGSAAGAVPTRQVIAAALAASDSGRNWQPSGSPTPTARLVRDMVEKGWKGSEGERKNPDIDKVLDAARNVEGDSEYARGLRLLAGSEIVAPKHLGLIASAVTVWRRNEEKAERERNAPEPPAQRWAGSVGDKMKGRKARIISCREFEAPNYMTGEPERRRAVTLRDERNHQIVWFTSSRAELPEPGTNVEFSGGTVSKQRHNDRLDADETVVTRAKLHAI